VLAYAAVLSPVLLLGADVVGRLVTRPAELQVGIVTAVLGGPVFIVLVRRRKMAEL
jgi:iron complex transport system permease protein